MPEPGRFGESLLVLVRHSTTKKFLVTILLLGQPELVPKVENMKQLDQWISVRCHLTTLKRNETTEYILHRLKVAGVEQPIFTEEALKLIHERSGGIPRRINQICDMCLFTAYTRQVFTVDELIVQKAL